MPTPPKNMSYRQSTLLAATTSAAKTLSYSPTTQTHADAVCVNDIASTRTKSRMSPHSGGDGAEQPNGRRRRRRTPQRSRSLPPRMTDHTAPERRPHSMQRAVLIDEVRGGVDAEAEEATYACGSNCNDLIELLRSNCEARDGCVLAFRAPQHLTQRSPIRRASFSTARRLYLFNQGCTQCRIVRIEA